MYTAVMTKQSVSLQDGIYLITVLCEVSEAGEVVFSGKGTGRYNPFNPNLDDTKDSILLELKVQWDKWKAERTVFTSAGLDAEVSSLQNTVNAYINL
jgi:hypothetical protein